MVDAAGSVCLENSVDKNVKRIALIQIKDAGIEEALSLSLSLSLRD
jgi:hypothetical protein